METSGNPEIILPFYWCGKRTNFYTYLATAQKTKYAVVPIHTEEEFHLFNSSVSLNGNWLSPNGAPDFEGMAAWWSAKADGKNIFYKMHEHLESHYKKWTEKKQEKENLVNSLSQGKKNQERIQAPTYVAQVLDPFQFFDNDLTMNQPNELPPARKKGKRKSQQNDLSPILPVIASSPPKINATMAPVQITHTFATVHHPPNYPTQPSSNQGFMQWTLPSSVAGSSRRRRCMPCFDAGREDKMYECPGRNSRAKCQFSWF